MFCSNCGSKLPEGAKFCSVCGAKVLEAVRVDQAKEPAGISFADLPGADAENKPAEAPLKTRVTFDWSNVIDEPQKKVVTNLKSPWATTGSIEEREVYAEMSPSTERSRTMSFIDVLKAEKEQQTQAEGVKTPEIESIEATVAADSASDEPRPIEYTEILDPSFLNEVGVDKEVQKAPALHIAPLYDDFDEPVVTPFDAPEEEEEIPYEEPRFEEPEAEPELEEPVLEEPFLEEAAEEVADEFEEEVIEEPAEEPEQDYYFKDGEPVEAAPASDVNYEEYDAADLTELHAEAEPTSYEDEYLAIVDEEPAAEVVEEAAAEVTEEASVVEEPEKARWFDLPDFLKPREDEKPFEPAPEVMPAAAEEPAEEAVEETAPEVVEEAPAEEEPVLEAPVLDFADIDEEEEPALEAPVLDFADIDEEEEAVPEVAEEPAEEEEPSVEDEYLNVPVFETEETEEVVEEAAEEDPDFEYELFEMPEEPEEEPVAEVEEAPAVEEPAEEAETFEEYIDEPEAEPVAEEPVADDEFVDYGIDLGDDLGNAEDEYLNISTERGEVTRSTISFDPEDFDDDDEDDDDEDEDEHETFDEAPADDEDEEEEEKDEDEEPVEEPEEEPAEEAAEETAVDEEELFAEIEADAPVSGMTIAAPADKESEIEALKKRLAELMGTDWEEPQVIEKEDKLTVEELFEEPAEEPEQDYYFKDGEPVEAAPASDVNYEEYDAADLTELHAETEPASYEDEYLAIVDEEPAAEEAAEPVEVAEEAAPEVVEVAEEPAEDLSFEDELAKFMNTPVEEAAEVPEIEIPEVEAEAEAPEVEIPEIEEPEAEPEPASEPNPAEQSIDDFLASILKQEAAPVAAASGLAAAPVIENLVTEEPEVEEPAAEEPVAPEPVIEEPADIAEEVAEAAEDAAEEAPEFVIPEIEIPAIEPEEPAEEVVEEPVVEAEPEAAEEPAPEKKETDALSIEELEQDLFGASFDPDGEAEATKKIDKFYTLYKKNEEFQRLLDEEYNKLKAAGGPAPEQILPDPEPPASAAKKGKLVEDATIYQAFEIPKEALEEAEAKAAAAREAAPVKVEKAAPEDASAVAVAAVAAAGAAAAAADAPAPEVEYEEVDKGGGCLTVVAIVIAILLVILLAIILLLNFAPDSSLAIQIDSFIENITSHFTAAPVNGGQTLL